jgi:hypothetical protein
MKYTLVLFAGWFVVAVLAGGCRRGPEAEVVVEDTEFLPFENIGIGPNGTLTDTTEVVLRTEAEWDAYRSRLHSVGPFKKVDFSQEMVALIAVPSPSGGYGVEVESVEKKGDTITVSYVIFGPDRDCIPVEGRAVPYQAVKVRRAGGTVRFVHRTETLPCTFK